MLLGLALILSFPLALRLTTHLPGEGATDGASFLWNFWWMRVALASDAGFFSTGHLFAPAGVDLTLHTHTALPAFVGATVLGPLPLLTAHNVVVLAALFLNGVCAYLLAWRLTRDHAAAAIGGVVFAASPYVAGHLNGHFNLTHAWPIPLLGIAVLEASRGSIRWAIAAGLTMGLTVYVDYYYVLYQWGLAVAVGGFTSSAWSISPGRPGPLRRRAAQLVGVLVAGDVMLMVALLITGGFTIAIGSRVVSSHGFFNPLQAFWILLALLAFLGLAPRLAVRLRDPSSVPRLARAGVVMTAAFLVAAAPLLWRALLLALRGEYVTQRHFWRSGPPGVDLATLLLGNPSHGLWGDAVQGAYARFAIDPIESTAWLGVVPVALAMWAVRTHAGLGPKAGEGPVQPGADTADPMMWTVRQWMVIGVVFFVFALGPHLTAFGVNTGLILPQALLRYLPLVGNARMSGRAMVVCYLALAVLSAIAVADWRRRSRRPMTVAALAAILILADYLPAPFPVVPLDTPAIYNVLRNRPERGAVCELPLGIRDGFGDRGRLDERVLFYQTIHEHPLVGGFVARLPHRIVRTYLDDPLLYGLLSLSEPDATDMTAPALPDRRLASARLRAHGIVFIVLDRRTASAALIDYVERVLPLTLIAENPGRALYLVSP